MEKGCANIVSATRIIYANDKLKDSLKKNLSTSFISFNCPAISIARTLTTSERVGIIVGRNHFHTSVTVSP